MRREIRVNLNLWFLRHEGLITRAEAEKLGLTKSEIHNLLSSGEWKRIHRSIFRNAAMPPTPRQLLLAALMAAGHRAVASHRSAAHLWGLIDHPPAQPEITVPEQWARKLKGVTIHRAPDLNESCTLLHNGIYVTNPLRALADMAESVDVATLSAAIDRGVGRKLFAPPAMTAELDRRAKRGRPGIVKLRAALTERGVIGAPRPSALERMMHDIMERYNVPKADIEVKVGPDGEYRLDMAYVPIKFAVEVDGYVWHYTPEHQQRDNERRNKLAEDGWTLYIYTFLDATRRPAGIASEITSKHQKLTEQLNAEQLNGEQLSGGSAPG